MQMVALIWNQTEKQGNSKRGRGHAFLLPKFRHKHDT